MQDARRMSARDPVGVRGWLRRALVAGACLVLAGIASAADPPGTIETFAGGGDGGVATVANLFNPAGVAVDSDGNLYVTDTGSHRVRRVAPNGTITTIVGYGSSTVFSPWGIATGPGGSVYVVEAAVPSRLLKVDPDGTVTTVAALNTGQGVGGVAVDTSGNVYVSHSFPDVVRKVAPDGTVTTVAGDGTKGLSGDGGLATQARLNSPCGLALDADGNLLIADSNNHRIRKVTLDGNIETLVTISFRPRGIAFDAAGNLYVAMGQTQNRVRKVAPDLTVTTVAGNGTASYSGDGGSAITAGLNEPEGLAVDGSGNLYVADRLNNRIRKLTAGTISTAAGNGSASLSGDSGPATSAGVRDPGGVHVDPSGNVYIADTGNHRVRKVSSGGTITTVAGNAVPTDLLGTSGGFGGSFSGDEGLATSAGLKAPSSVAVDANGNLYIADTLNHRVRRVAAADGRITTFAGNGTAAFSGDGGLATIASLRQPGGVAVDGSGNVYIADSQNHRVRKVDANGIITTLAGTGTASFSGDGGLANSAGLNGPHGIAVDASGNVYIADSRNHRVRIVAHDTIHTFAGNGTSAYSGDEGPATSAGLREPYGLVVDPAGQLYVTSTSLVRKVRSDGTITTVAGMGLPVYCGDGGPAVYAGIANPTGVALDTSGNLYIADTGNHRIRRVKFHGAAAIAAPATVVGECDDEHDATVRFGFTITPGPATLLRAWDLRQDRLLLDVSNPAQGEYEVGPVAFPDGESTVRIELSDGTGVLASATVSVQVNDTLAPTISGAGAVTLELQARMTPLAPEALGISAQDACDTTPTIAIAPDAVPLGTTPVTVTAQDATGNTATATFDVTVLDRTPPVFTVLPVDESRACTEEETLVSFDVLAEDLSGDVGVVCVDQDGRAVDPAGTPFHVGENTITCTATDGSGNWATLVFHIAIVDDHAPLISVPQDITVNTAPGQCFAYVTFAIHVDDACADDVTIDVTTPFGPVASGDAFPVGTTPVTVTATDPSGNVATKTFNVTVLDKEPPVISGPQNITIVTDCAGSPVAATLERLGLTVTDNCDPNPVVTFDPSIVPLPILWAGTLVGWSVTVVARDRDGNTRRRVVGVTVLKGALTTKIDPPLRLYEANAYSSGQPIRLAVRYTCDGRPYTGELRVTAYYPGWFSLIAVPLTRQGGNGSPFYQGQVPTSPHFWARFRVLIRAEEMGRVDTQAWLDFYPR